jgi:hypothetical protein
VTLYLYEISSAEIEHNDAAGLIKELDAQIHRVGGELIEAQVTNKSHRIFAIAEYSSVEPAPLDAAAFQDVQLDGPHQVRLVGADLADLKALRPSAGYLVEWDLPEELDMESYLARKKANAPKYAEVPEVSFLRTYVREDMDKCLCFYDAPDEAAVLRAREAVQTPVDRLHGIDSVAP